MSATVESFLGAVWGDGYHSLCAKRPGGRFRAVDVFADPANMLVAAGRLNGDDVWFGVHGMADVPERRGGATDVTSVVTLMADIDWADPAHHGADLPSEEEVRSRLRRLGELAPSMIINSGHGLQLYWLLTENVGAELGATVQARLDAHLLDLGLVNERSDLASVLRLPGTTNCKAEPVPVVIEHADLGRRFVSEYLLKRLPKLTKRRATSARSPRQLDGRDEDAVSVLVEHFGGHSPLVLSDHIEVTRPGKPRDSSASIGMLGPGVTKVWTSNWPPFKQGQVLSLHELRRLAGVEEPRVKVPPSAETFGMRARMLSTVEPEEVLWLWAGRLPLGKVVVLDGDPAVGKSTMMIDVAARVSVGVAMPGQMRTEREPAAVVIMSAEDGLADTIRPRLDAAGGNPELVHAVTAVADVDEHGKRIERLPSLPDDVDYLGELVVSLGARLVVVDVLMAYLAGSTNSYRDQDVRLALAPLAAMAERTGCCVVVLRHIRKASTTNALYSGGGSIGIIGAARVGLLAAYDPDDENPDENVRRRVLAVTKCNLAAKADSLGYRIVPAGMVGRIEWLGTVRHRADDLVNHDGRDDERADKETFLAELLGGGPVLADDVEKAARRQGWSMKQLRPVLRHLGGTSKPLEYNGPWYWWLPDFPPDLPDFPTSETGKDRQDRGKSDGATQPCSVCGTPLATIPGLDVETQTCRDCWTEDGP